MSLEEIVNSELKLAMKAKDKIKLDSLRGIKKEIIEAKTAKGASSELNPDSEVKILQKMVKQRQEAATIFKDRGREDLAGEELAQMEIIAAFLPEQLSPEEIEVQVESIIDELGVTSMAGMGKVMAESLKRFGGKADSKAVSDIVKRKLAK